MKRCLNAFVNWGPPLLIGLSGLVNMWHSNGHAPLWWPGRADSVGKVSVENGADGDEDWMHDGGRR